MTYPLPSLYHWSFPGVPVPDTLLPVYWFESVLVHRWSTRKPWLPLVLLPDASSITAPRVVAWLVVAALDPEDQSVGSTRPTALASPYAAPWPRVTRAKPSAQFVPPDSRLVV